MRVGSSRYGGATGRRHAVGEPRRGHGFRGRALVLAGGLAMVGGLATGLVLDREALTGTAPDDVATDPQDSGVLRDIQVTEAEERPEAQRPPEPLPQALAAVPAVIDATLVDSSGLTFADRSAGLLSAEVPTAAGGDLLVVPGVVPAPLADRTVMRVRVEVEAGLAVDGELFAAMVMATLNDQRSWGGDGSMTFARTDGADQDLRVVLASPDKVDAMCAPLNTHGDYSCGRYGHAAINYTRWVQATEEFVDKTLYRQYVVNHEVGHLLGHQHTSCTGAGDLAPIMQQQSIRVAPCLPNAWPFPAGT